MKFKLLIILSLLFVLAGCSSQLNDSQAREASTEKSRGKIEIYKNKINQGNISMKDGKVDIEFLLKNTGEDPVVLMEGQTSCICTDAVVKTKIKTAEGADDTITSRVIKMPHGVAGPTDIYQIVQPGDEATVVATFDPNAHGPNGTGPIRRNVIISTNSLISPTIDLSFLGNVVK